MSKIAITGASGLIGSALVGDLRDKGHEVLRLVRRPVASADEVQWDPKNESIDIASLAGVSAVINLAGAGVGDKRWTSSYKNEILNSRVSSTHTIATAVEELKPDVFISASAIGWYGETGDRAVTEVDRGGDDFLAGVCEQWEAAADLAPSIRTVKIEPELCLIQPAVR